MRMNRRLRAWLGMVGLAAVGCGGATIDDDPDAYQPDDAAVDATADDGGNDAPADGVDAPDVADSHDSGTPFTVGVASWEAWSEVLTGGGQHALFTLRLNNRGAGAVTNFTVTSGVVRKDPGGSPLFDFSRVPLTVGTADGPAFDGRVPGGESLDVVGHARSTDSIDNTACGNEVTLGLAVTWNSTFSSFAEAPAVALDCPAGGD